MSDSGHQLELRVVGAESSGPAPPRCSLCVTFDLAAGGDSAACGRVSLRLLAGGLLGVAPDFGDLVGEGACLAPPSSLLDLGVTFDQIKGFAELAWSDPRDHGFVARGRVRVTGGDRLTWELETEGGREPLVTSHQRNSIRATLGAWLKRFPTTARA
jgi:hypothetical protein